MADDVLTRNENDELAVRVVSTSGDTSTNPNDVYTRDENGKLCVRVTGGGGDQHNLGYFATLQALQEAYPTAEAGDWAIVGATDTVWIWDTDTSAWVDSDQKGQVTSVNNQTGAVTLTASDVGALPSNTHIPADQVNADWNANSGVAEILNKPTLGTMAAESADDYTKTANLATVATTGAYSDLSGTPTIPDPTQVSTLPTASADELGNIYQFVGTTDANYTNGYFYKCVSDGQQPATYSWTQVNVQPQGSSLPSQTGNAGKFLTTDGTDASWSDKPLINNSSTSGQLNICPVGGTPNTTDAYGQSIVIGNNIKGGTGVSYGSVRIGNNINTLNAMYGDKGVFISGGGGISKAGGSLIINGASYATTNSSGRVGGLIIGSGYVPVGIGALSGGTEKGGAFSIAIGGSTNQPVSVNADYTLLFNTGYDTATAIEDANTFWWGNSNGLYKLFDTDGTIPESRLADTTSALQGQVLTLDSNLNAVWTTPSGGGATSATATLAVAGWSNNTQTVNVTGVTATNVVFVSPAPASAADYASAGIVCTAQGAGTLTFTCTTVPSNAITVNVVCL